ncbi:hypothetical protein Anapl_06273 [Anas platyrhynchos]|uniref:Uncharacterized protein n=1 Tax=Anas platyrhynchos TaxID=8839 RepID=R0LR95_ANAPL|nr:hypothetical protein Anapl_06273 [Anas platyrhynchos]
MYAASEQPPRHCVLPWPLGAHASWEQKDREGQLALLRTKSKSKGGKQEHSGKLMVFEAELGGLGGESVAKPECESLNRERQRIQCGCGGEHKHPARESSRTGHGGCGRRKEGKFPVRALGGEGCQFFVSNPERAERRTSTTAEHFKRYNKRHQSRDALAITVNERLGLSQICHQQEKQTQ